MMIQLNKLTITLALLMTAATGAWADVDPTVTPTTNKNEWQFAMPKGNVLLMVTYKDRTQTALTYGNEAIPAEGVTAYLGFEAEFAKKLVATAMNRENIWAFPVTNAESFTYESNYTGAETDVIAFRDGDNGYKAKGALADIVFLREGTATLTVRFKGDDDLSRSRVRLTVKVEQKPYLLDLADGTDDAGGWQGKAGTATSYGPLPLTDVKKDQPVELKYDGRLKVKGVTARVVPTVDLALLSADDLEDDYQTYIVHDGAMLTGKLDGEKQPYKIVIPNGATVTLNGVNIDGSFHANNFMGYQWAGITCAGNATIILKGTNTVTGFFGYYPGIQAGPSGTTLTIRGNGTLTAASNGYGTGIGSAYYGSDCGDITILGGNITANGGSGSAGIGSANNSRCGNITITDGVTRVTATKGDEAPNSIGWGKDGSCGTVTIGGTVYWDGSDYENEGNTYLTEAEFVYRPLVTLLAVTTGAWVQTESNIITWNAEVKTASIAAMPAGNVIVSVEYCPFPTMTGGELAANSGVVAGSDTKLLRIEGGTSITVSGGHLMYAIGNSSTQAPTDGWVDDIPTAESLVLESESDVYVWWKLVGDDDHSNSKPQCITVSVAPSPKYDVTLNKEGLADGEANYVKAHSDDVAEVTLGTEDLKGVKKGETVTVSYTGTKRVAGVKARKVVNVVNLSTLTGNFVAQNGDILTGKLVGNYKVSIADGATVTLAGVTIEGVNNTNYRWAGITCEGDATIVVEDGTSNSVKGFDLKLPGIQVSGDSKLTIKGGSLGTGSLVASSNGAGAGIGGAFNDYCGEIEIQGGNITATGGRGAAGIGGGEDGFWGDIIISGGQVMAIGGNGAAGIGSGYAGDENIYGNISIMGGTVNAIGGNGGPGIGSGCGEQGNPSILTAYCRDITISGGTVMATGGDGAAGIGNGSEYSECGAISITSTVNSVTATKGENAANSIGNSGGKSCSCGEVTIEDPDKVTQN